MPCKALRPGLVRGSSEDAPIAALRLHYGDFVTSFQDDHRDLQAILRQASGLPASVPAGIRQIVTNCLDKDPTRRFQSARDRRHGPLRLSAKPCSQPPPAPEPRPKPLPSVCSLRDRSSRSRLFGRTLAPRSSTRDHLIAAITSTAAAAV
jgi:serine/threonine protein kinase